MSITEPFEINSGDAILKHQDNFWDLETLGLKISEIISLSGSVHNIKNVLIKYLNNCKKESKDMSIIRVSHSDYDVRKILVEQGYYLNDYSYIVECRVSNLKNISFTDKIKISNNCLKEDLYNLVFNMFHHGRFLEDLNLNHERSSHRNQKWAIDLLKSNCEGKFLYKKEKLIGFMFYEATEKIIELKLGGVVSKYQHVAPQFWSYILSCFNNGKSIKTNISAANLGVLNLYNHFGFKVTECLVGYHKTNV
jgi:ribosomal protein S8